MSDFELNIDYSEDMTEEPGYKAQDTVASRKPGNNTLYSQLRQEFNRPAPVSTITLAVPTREKLKVTYRADISWDDLRRWTRAATDRKSKQVDPIQLATYILSNCMESIQMDGQVVTSPEDNETPITVGDEEFRKIFGEDIDTRTALRKLYDEQDGHVLSAMRMVMTAAGFGSEDEDMLDDDEVSASPL